MPSARPRESTAEEMPALAVVATGLLVLGGSAPLHVVWLVVIGIGSVVALLRRSATRSPESPGEKDPPS